MTQMGTTETILVSVVVLLIVLIVLMILFWIFRLSRNRNPTVLKISAARHAHVVTITTDPDHAQQMLDHLLDRVYLQVEPGAGFKEERGEEDGAESAEERGDSPSGPAPAAPSLFSQAEDNLGDTQQMKSIPTNETNNLDPEESHHASLSS